MKVYIVALIQGVSGIVHTDQVNPASPFPYLYQEARRLLAQEIAAVVEGAREAGARQVIVKDATGGVPFPEEHLHAGAFYIFGGPHEGLFPELAGSQAAVLLGHPAAAGTWGAVLCQSFSSYVQRLWLNGRELGTIGIHAAACGTLDVPVVLVSGDNFACAEAEKLLSGVKTCTTKWGLGYHAAKLRNPATVRQDLRNAVRDLLSSALLPAPWEVPPPYEVRVEVTSTEVLDRHVFSPPLSERLDGRTALLRGKDLPELAATLKEVL